MLLNVAFHNRSPRLPSSPKSGQRTYVFPVGSVCPHTSIAYPLRANSVSRHQTRYNQQSLSCPVRGEANVPRTKSAWAPSWCCHIARIPRCNIPFSLHARPIGRAMSWLMLCNAVQPAGEFDTRQPVYFWGYWCTREILLIGF